MRQVSLITSTKIERPTERSDSWDPNRSDQCQQKRLADQSCRSLRWQLRPYRQSYRTWSTRCRLWSSPGPYCWFSPNCDRSTTGWTFSLGPLPRFRQALRLQIGQDPGCWCWSVWQALSSAARYLAFDQLCPLELRRFCCHVLFEFKFIFSRNGSLKMFNVSKCCQVFRLDNISFIHSLNTSF